MSIQSEITRINTNIANAYAAVQTMGGTLPATQNSANLPAAIATIDDAYNYIQLDYLYSPGSGACCIDTGVTGGSAIGYELGFKITTVSRNWARYMGAGPSNADLPPYPILTSDQSGTGNKPIKITSTVNGSQTSYYTFYPSNDWHTVVVDGSTVKFDNSVKSTSAINQGWGSYSCRLFTTTWLEGGAACYISYCKMYTDGVLVRDFVPAKRKADNVLGMYDKLNKTFYTNTGTGSFTAGSEVGPVSTVVVPSPSAYTGSIANQIARINENIANAYNVCAQLGRTMPTAMNSVNLGPTILDGPKYTVDWENYDSSLLKQDLCYSGETPVYTGSKPYKLPDNTYRYFFNGWSPTIVPVTQGTTYTAQYTASQSDFNITYSNFWVRDPDYPEYSSYIQVGNEVNQSSSGTMTVSPSSGVYVKLHCHESGYRTLSITIYFNGELVENRNAAGSLVNLDFDYQFPLYDDVTITRTEWSTDNYRFEITTNN